MEILGLEKVSMVDFEGKICATIFTGGCNFCCPFCHNAGIVFKEFMPYEEEYIFEYLQERKRLLDAVTISGGEPTLHKDLPEFIAKIKALGYLVKLDTNGTNPTMLKSLIERGLVDYFAMDIKTNFENYPQITGIKVNMADKVKASLKVLQTSGIDFELRTTLVKQFHSQQNIEKMAKELEGCKSLALQKYVASPNCISAKLDAVNKEVAKIFKQILEKKIDKVFLRGY